MLGDLTHDLRGPLTVIRGEVQLVLGKEGVDSEERGHSGAAVLEELERIDETVRRRREARGPYVESRKSTFLDRPPIELGGVAVMGSQEATEDEKGAGSTLVPAGINRYLYLIPGAFLVLALTAAALAFIPAGDRQPAVSQVREPLISEAPRESSPVSSEKVERASQPQHKDDKQVTDNENDGPQLQQPAAAPDAYTDDVLADQTVQAWQDQGASPRPARDPRYATATPSASPTAETTPPATAEPDDTPTSPTTEQDTATTPPSTEPDTATTPPATEPDTATTPPTTEPDTATTPPATEAPAQRRSEASPPPTAGPGLTSPGSRDSGGFDVEVVPGSCVRVNINTIRCTGLITTRR
jgi:phospho-acceptor domain-containing protein